MYGLAACAGAPVCRRSIRSQVAQPEKKPEGHDVAARGLFLTREMAVKEK
jgi:hypothetical protein